MSHRAPYTVRIARSAEREMDDLPPNVFPRVADAIHRLAGEPRPRGCRKLRGQDEYRVRVGRYRVLYTIGDHNRQVDVFAVGHRRDVYRNL